MGGRLILATLMADLVALALAVPAAGEEVPVTIGAAGPLFRAHYETSGTDIDADSAIAELSGDYTIEFADACDGWTREEKRRVVYRLNAGSVIELADHQWLWEAKDGSALIAGVDRRRDGELRSQRRITARRLSDGTILVERSRPSVEERALASDVHFPIAFEIIARFHLAEADRFDGLMFSGLIDDAARRLTVTRLEPPPAEALGVDGVIPGLLAGEPERLRVEAGPGPGADDDDTARHLVELLGATDGIAVRSEIDIGQVTLVDQLVFADPLPAPDC